MSKKPEKQIKKITQGSLQRRLAVSIAGAKGGAKLLAAQAGSMFMADQQKHEVREQALATEARAFTTKLGELKGAYVKIGQMMALYGDHLLPKAVTDALHELEHQTTSLEWPIIQRVIQSELGTKCQDLRVDKNALAAASLAQVHRASKTSSTEKLCIKVQYPGVADTIEADFKVVMQMLKLARWVKQGRDLEAWMQELKFMLLDEVDYPREQAMTQEVDKLLRGDDRYLVPKIDAEYSGQKVITMQYLSGYEVTHKKIAGLSQHRRNKLATAMLEIFFKEVFEWGIMQTDPNFGNYRIQLKDSVEMTDKLVLLDFGAVRQLDESFLKALQKTILATHLNNREKVIEGAIELNCIRESHSEGVKESFADFCILLMEPFRKDKFEIPGYALNSRRQYKWHESMLLKRVGKFGAKSMAVEGFSTPPKEFALIARKLTGVFTFVTTLKAEISAHKILEKYLN